MNDSANPSPNRNEVVDTQAGALPPLPLATNSQPPATSEIPISQVDDCVPFFKTDRRQLIFEFSYLVLTFIVASIALWGAAYQEVGNNRTLLIAALGGFFGGWTFDAKWFYRVTARGRDNQHKQVWQRHKFYWRMLIPFVAGLISFAAYLLASSDAFPIQVKNPQSGRMAFGLTFFMGLFTDILLSRLARWTETLIPEKGA